jgi:Reverse transcriptase (RNA-dependent DNA polymerase)
MQEPDAEDFRKAMEKEIVDQWDNDNFRLFNRKHVPPDKNILPGVWALRRKRNSHTEVIKKHKARWNRDGSNQVHGVDFDNTYAPTVTWPGIRLVLTLLSIHSWKTQQLDFVQAFPQADISHQQFVELPMGIEIEGVNSNDWVFEALRNLYGGKNAGRQWYLHLKRHLEDIRFKVSQHDECEASTASIRMTPYWQLLRTKS